MKDKRRVFILGAGFSRQIGMPLATELTELLFQEFREIDHNEAVQWFKAFTQKVRRLSGSDAINIEELFHYARFDAESWKMEQQLYPIGRNDGMTRWGRAEAIESWLEHMEYDLADVILTKQESAQSLVPIENFANSLNTSDAVITFNYDTLVEDALTKAKQSWNHGLNDFQKGQIAVLKMHGSLDWVILERGETAKGQKHQLLFQKQDKNRERVTTEKPSGEIEYDYELARIEKSALKGWIENRDLQRGPWKSVGMAGLGSYKPLHRLPGSGIVWARARGHLENADEIIIVGFSFSPFDAMVRLCFCDVMADRDPKIIAIDPCAERKEYQSVVKSIFGENITFIEKRAEKIKWDQERFC